MDLAVNLFSVKITVNFQISTFSVVYYLFKTGSEKKMKIVHLKIDLQKLIVLSIPIFPYQMQIYISITNPFVSAVVLQPSNTLKIQI